MIKITRQPRPGEKVIPAEEVRIGMIITPDSHSRDPDNIYLVTEISKNSILRGVYIGPETNRDRETGDIMGRKAGNVVWFPHASINLHGE